MKDRILFILHLPPPVHGAAKVGSYIYQSGLLHNSFKCSYINLGTSKDLREIGGNPITKFFRTIRIILRVLKEVILKEPKLVYISPNAAGVGFYKDSLIALLVKLFGKKVIYHLHNKGVYKRQHLWLDNFLYTRVFKNSEVILLSKHLYYDLEKYVPKERVHICPNGIPMNKLQPSFKNEGNDRVRLLFLSNLIESKGVFVLLEACRILKQRGLPFECSVIGGEKDITVEQFQTKVEQLGLSDIVSYGGKKYDLDKEVAYSNSDIFVFPTYYHNECFPLVLLEAMQFALPVVSTFEGGIPDIVEEGTTGFLVKQKDALTLADRLEALISDADLRYRMGRAGRKRFEECFTLDRFEKRIEKVLTELI